MRFFELGPGERFSFAGHQYRKISPLQARDEADGAQRLIARSAVVTPLTATQPPPPAPDRLPGSVAVAAIEQMTAVIGAAIEAPGTGLEERGRAALRETLASARTAALKTLQGRPAAAADPLPNTRETEGTDEQ